MGVRHSPQVFVSPCCVSTSKESICFHSINRELSCSSIFPIPYTHFRVTGQKWTQENQQVLIGLIQSKLNLMISRVKDKCMGWDVGVCSQWEGNDRWDGGSETLTPCRCVWNSLCQPLLSQGSFCITRGSSFLSCKLRGAETISSFPIYESWRSTAFLPLNNVTIRDEPG